MKHKIVPLKVLMAGVAWRKFGSRDAAKILLEAMSGNDEQNRMLAGMALVKAKARSVDLIEKKIALGEVTPPIIRLLPDLGGPRIRALLNEIAFGDPGELAETAKQCLDLLDRIGTLGPDDK